MNIAIRSVQLQIAPQPDRKKPEVYSAPQARVLALVGLNTIHNLEDSKDHYWDIDYLGYWEEDDGSIGWHILGTQKAFAKGDGLPWTAIYECVVCGCKGLDSDEVFCGNCIDRSDTLQGVCLKCGADTPIPESYHNAGKDDLCDKCAEAAGVTWTTPNGRLFPEYMRTNNAEA